MNKGQGVVIINYVDDKIAENPITGVPNNIFFNAYEVKFIHDTRLLSITQTFGEEGDLYFKTSYIPLSNIGFIEQFINKENFYKAYPLIKKMEEGE